MIKGLLGLNLTEPGCKDNGCWIAFGGAGECVEIGALSLNQLAQKFVFVFVFGDLKQLAQKLVFSMALESTVLKPCS